jgi:hypothetical protein
LIRYLRYKTVEILRRARVSLFFFQNNIKQEGKIYQETKTKEFQFDSDQSIMEKTGSHQPLISKWDFFGTQKSPKRQELQRQVPAAHTANPHR